MTSTTTGLPDRYRPLDQVGPDETTPTGVIHCWRAKDRVLNRDVAIRVHTPAGQAAHAWIARALTAGGLATPALAMVYDASEGTGDPQAPGGAAYVVNEWIEGETLAERLRRGPIPERDARLLLRRLAEGVAEAHRVGLPVGGLSLDNVVLRPNGLVGLRAVPAATGTVDGDIAALGALLEACLTGLPSGDAGTSARPLSGPSDLVALVRRARSTEPGQGLSSVAAMAALLAERPRTGPGGASPAPHRDDPDSGWLRRLRERHGGAPAEDEDTELAGAGALDIMAPAEDLVPLGQHDLPPVPAVRPVTAADGPVPPAALGGDTIDAGSVHPHAGAYAGSGYGRGAHAAPPPPVTTEGNYAADQEPFGALPVPEDDETFSGVGYEDDLLPSGAGTQETPRVRRRLLAVLLSILALVVVVGLAWWIGTRVMSVADSVDTVHGSAPSTGVSAGSSSGAPKPVAGAAVKIVSAKVYDPQGDGQPENDKDVPLSFDGNPSTAWSTLQYRGSATFGNLKKGVGVLYDLGSEQSLAGVTVDSSKDGASLEVRTGSNPTGPLDSFPVAASGTVTGSTALTFDKPVTSRYVLVWITGLVPSDGGFSATLAEVTIHAAG